MDQTPSPQNATASEIYPTPEAAADDDDDDHKDDKGIFMPAKPTNGENPVRRSELPITPATSSPSQIRRGRKPTPITAATRGKLISSVANNSTFIPLRSSLISALNATIFQSQFLWPTLMALIRPPEHFLLSHISPSIFPKSYASSSSTAGHPSHRRRLPESGHNDNRCLPLSPTPSLPSSPSSLPSLPTTMSSTINIVYRPRCRLPVHPTPANRPLHVGSNVDNIGISVARSPQPMLMTNRGSIDGAAIATVVVAATGMSKPTGWVETPCPIASVPSSSKGPSYLVNQTEEQSDEVLKGLKLLGI
ncbi:hypothetical protein ACLOJK_027025 [Asimina triloba]